ncbi:MAG: hypothetical protein BWY91_02479 [bacterium ADurb.BinA028]|nr:MAG: hypothetical protein BWY91_02479 [bacterium ADurb.BinA028]
MATLRPRSSRYQLWHPEPHTVWRVRCLTQRPNRAWALRVTTCGPSSSARCKAFRMCSIAASIMTSTELWPSAVFGPSSR